MSFLHEHPETAQTGDLPKVAERVDAGAHLRFRVWSCEAIRRGLSRIQKLALLPVIAFVLSVSGCKDKPADAEITSLMRAEAANLASEAEFAVKLRDYARAEPLLAKAVELTPDEPEYWVALGSTRLRLDQKSGARTAYRRALEVYEGEYEKDATNVDALLQRIYVHALLGETDKARSLLAQAGKDHPTDPFVQSFIRAGGLDQMLADPVFKETAL